MYLSLLIHLKLGSSIRSVLRSQSSSPKQQYSVARYFQTLYRIYTSLYFLPSTSEGSLFDNECDKKFLDMYRSQVSPIRSSQIRLAPPSLHVTDASALSNLLSHMTYPSIAFIEVPM